MRLLEGARDVALKETSLRQTETTPTKQFPWRTTRLLRTVAATATRIGEAPDLMTLEFEVPREPPTPAPSGETAWLFFVVVERNDRPVGLAIPAPVSS